MEGLVLSRCLLLKIALELLQFTEPTYRLQTKNNDISRAQVRFRLNNIPDEASSDDSHVIMSGWFNSVHAARENAASRALAYLQTKIKFYVQDYSYYILPNLRNKKQNILVRCCVKAEALDTLMLSWLSMTDNMKHASKNYAALALRPRNLLFHPKHISTVDNLVQHITSISKTLAQLHEENMIDARRTRQPVHELLDHFLTLRNPVTCYITDDSMTASVTIHPTVMLQQLLAMCQVTPPIYEDNVQDDGKTLSHCIFYSSTEAMASVAPEVIYGFPDEDIAIAHENAALRSLQYLDAQFHMQLVDYNFDMKEYEVEELRSLGTKNKRLAAMVQAYDLWRESILKLSSLLEPIEAYVSHPFPPDCPPELLSALQPFIEATQDIQQHLQVTSNTYYSHRSV